MYAKLGLLGSSTSSKFLLFRKSVLMSAAFIKNQSQYSIVDLKHCQYSGQFLLPSFDFLVSLLMNRVIFENKKLSFENMNLC